MLKAATVSVKSLLLQVTIAHLSTSTTGTEMQLGSPVARLCYQPSTCTVHTLPLEPVPNAREWLAPLAWCTVRPREGVIPMNAYLELMRGYAWFVSLRDQSKLCSCICLSAPYRDCRPNAGELDMPRTHAPTTNLGYVCTAVYRVDLCEATFVCTQFEGRISFTMKTRRATLSAA